MTTRDPAPSVDARPRITRPELPRDRPIRAWSTLFGPARAEPSARSPSAERAEAPASSTRPKAVGEAVEQGYRVIEEYLRQGQKLAAAWRPSSPGTAPPGELPETWRRMVEYGWDMAALWLELWAGSGASNAPPPWASFVPPLRGAPWQTRADAEAHAPWSGEGPSGDFPPNSAWPFVTGSEPRGGEARPASEPREQPLRSSVSVVAEVPTETLLELRKRARGELALHALRPEGHDAPAIRSVSVGTDDEDGSVTVRVVVPSGQPAGLYNAMLIDTTTNLPCGTLSLRVMVPERRAEAGGERVAP